MITATLPRTVAITSHPTPILGPPFGSPVPPGAQALVSTIASQAQVGAALFVGSNPSGCWDDRPYRGIDTPLPSPGDDGPLR